MKIFVEIDEIKSQWGRARSLRCLVLRHAHLQVYQSFLRDYIRNPAQNFFWLIRARTSSYKLYRAKEQQKSCKSISNLQFTRSGTRWCREKVIK
jgi:hypothetical protein